MVILKLNPVYNSIYVHIPFCKQRCNYCDFLSHVYEKEKNWAALYGDLVCRELSQSKPAIAEKALIGSVYFGGGTPTMLPAADLNQILATIKANFRLAESLEITVETNPATVDLAYLQSLKSGGFNRISMGAQSFVDEELVAMGRIHQADEIGQTVDLCRQAGFDNVGLDLIYGLPGQSLAGWQSNLGKAVALGVEHISLYSLQVDNQSLWGQKFQQGQLAIPDNDAAGDMLELAIDFLAGAGYRQYEIANFAKVDSRRDYASKHNQSYWQRLDYLGVGLGAASCFGKKRWQNIGTLADYGDALLQGGKPPKEMELLTARQLLGELVWLGLRRLEGVDATLVEEKYGVDILTYFAKEIAKLKALGLLEVIDRVEPVKNLAGCMTSNAAGTADVDSNTDGYIDGYTIEETDLMQKTGLIKETGLMQETGLGQETTSAKNALSETHQHQTCDQAESLKLGLAGKISGQAKIIRLTPKGLFLGNQVFEEFV